MIDKYKILNQIEHVKIRPDSYIGNIFPHSYNDMMLIDIDKNISTRDIKVIPGFIKIFDEVLTNSVDHSKRAEGNHLNIINIKIDKLQGSIEIYDNGGIPVILHPTYNKYIPDFIFSELLSGSNFEDSDERFGAGRNGLGVKLTNIFSTIFTVNTSDGKNRFNRTYYDNNQSSSDIKISSDNRKFTIIKYIPDYRYFNMESLDKDHYDFIINRIWNIKASNPHIKISINNKELNLSSYFEYCKLFYPQVTCSKIDKWTIGLGLSFNGFKQISSVNSVCTYYGGTHIDFISDKLVYEIRDYIEKKTKQKIKPSDIKNHFFLFLDCLIPNPRFDSQTKERLISESNTFNINLKFDDKFIKTILKSKVVEEILNWAERKQQLEDLALVKKKQKELKKDTLYDIVKYEPATEKLNRNQCSLFLTEGLSASNTIISTRNSKLMGSYPLKGKFINVRDLPFKQILENEEFSDIIRILGLKIGENNNVHNLRYGKLIIAADFDSDGSHICGLIINMFASVFPELLEQNFIYRLITPLIKVKQGKEELEFFSLKEFHNWERNQTKKYTFNYYKGLGTWNSEEFKKYIHNSNYLLQITKEDDNCLSSLDMAFNKKRADDRKLWLQLQ